MTVGGASRGPARTVVWDLGGVLLRWQPLELLRQTIVARHPDADADTLRAAIFGGDHWHEFDSGRIGREELVPRAAAAAGLDPVDVDVLLDAIPAHLVDLDDSWRLVRRVTAAGRRVVYLSNMPHAIARLVEPRVGPLFEGGLFSCDAGDAKPSAGIFRTAEDRLSLDGGSLLFFDDSEANVVTARELGWRAEVFTGADDAARVLADEGWL